MSVRNFEQSVCKGFRGETRKIKGNEAGVGKEAVRPVQV